MQRIFFYFQSVISLQYLLILFSNELLISFIVWSDAFCPGFLVGSDEGSLFWRNGIYSFAYFVNLFIGFCLLIIPIFSKHFSKVFGQM